MKTKVEPTVERWEREFDEKFTFGGITGTVAFQEARPFEVKKFIRTLLSHSLQEAKAEERERTKKLIDAIHEQFKRDVLKLTNPALALAAGIEIEINKYENELSTLTTKEGE